MEKLLNDLMIAFGTGLFIGIINYIKASRTNNEIVNLRDDLKKAEIERVKAFADYKTKIDGMLTTIIDAIKQTRKYNHTHFATIYSRLDRVEKALNIKPPQRKEK